MCGGGSQRCGQFFAVEIVERQQAVEVRVIPIAGVEIAERDGGGELLGDDGGERVTEELEAVRGELLRVVDDLRPGSDGVAETDVQLELETRTGDRCGHGQPYAVILVLLSDGYGSERGGVVCHAVVDLSGGDRGDSADDLGFLAGEGAAKDVDVTGHPAGAELGEQKAALEDEVLAAEGDVARR